MKDTSNVSNKNLWKKEIKTTKTGTLGERPLYKNEEEHEQTLKK